MLPSLKHQEALEHQPAHCAGCTIYVLSGLDQVRGVRPSVQSLRWCPPSPACTPP